MSTIEKAVRRLAEKRAQEEAGKGQALTGSALGNTGEIVDRAPSDAPGPEVATAAAGVWETQGVAVSDQTAAGSSSSPESGAPGSEFESLELEVEPKGLTTELKLTENVSDLILSSEGGRNRTAEEFRVIKRPLLVNAFNGAATAGKPSNLIMVSSSVQGEGKTFTSLNLAISITLELDSAVLLVDADVAKPGLSKTLGVEDKPGLIEHLVDRRNDLSGMLLRTDIPTLTVLPAGQKHKLSTELLASANMKRLVGELANRYSDRIVLFDSPPLLETSEASVLASLMGQVVIVVEYETTSRVTVKAALSQLEDTDNAYLILNKCEENSYSGKNGYRYDSNVER